MVSAIVVNYNRGDLLVECLRSLEVALDRLDEASELVVVDNGSTDGSPDLVAAEFPEAALLGLPENRGFAGGVAAGLRQARGAWILLLNNDAVAEPDCVLELMAVARSETQVGSVAAQMRFAGRNEVINSAGIEVDRLGIAYDRLLGAPVAASEEGPVEVFGSSAGAALYSRAMLADVGGFDETFFAFLEDADLAWRARMGGWRSFYAPSAVVLHHHSATAVHGSSRKFFLVGRNRVRLLAKNADARQLVRYGPAMVAYDVAYVLYAAVRGHTLAPIRGRLRGLLEWRAYRRHSAPRRPVELAQIQGLRRALTRNAEWTRH